MGETTKSFPFAPVTFPQQRLYKGEIFPLCLAIDDPEAKSPLEATLQYITQNRQDVDDLLRKHKGIVFRKCGFTDANTFHDAIESTGFAAMDYIGGAAVRTQLTSRVFTANESPSSEKIPFHHEMAQTPDPPTHLFFFCETEPEEGGETPILVSSEIYERARQSYPDFMDKLEKDGLRYVRYMPEYDDPTSAIGRGWRSTYLTDSREGAEAKLRAQGSDWEWQDNGNLKTITAVVPAVRFDGGDARSEEWTFVNSMVAAFTGWNDSRNVGEKAVIHGDTEGTVCDAEAIRGIADMMDEICVSMRWQKGDLMLLDNRTTMHSRRPYKGARRILAGLARDPAR
jgi:alpha-ketoglutarate-dependent taurine dioxygenase